jgi:outer membrane receptor protein involved in Fe transport
MHCSKNRLARIFIPFLAAAGAAYAGNVAAQQSALDEVVVTAQKRTETLTEIPMSVTVLGGDLLERQRVEDFQDLVTVVPGFSINSNTAGVSRITLRGINTGGVASTVGVYVNDVPFGSSSGLANAAILSGDFDTFDLERIEVLRGPQGTLYGASSLGGVLKYVTRKPSTEAFEARGQVSVETVKGGDLGYSARGVVNVPVTETLALRATGFYRFDDGFIDSIGNNPIPSLLDPTVNVVNGTRVEEDFNSTDVYGGRVAALFQPVENLSIDLAAQFQNIEADSSAIVDADPVTLKPLNRKDVRSRYHKDPSDIEYRLYSATIDWDLGFATFQSVTSYSEFEHKFTADMAANTQLGLPLAPAATLFFGDPVARPLSVIQRQETSTDKLTQEFRLVSAENDTLEWLLGVYYTDEDSAIAPQEILAVEAGTDIIATDIPALAAGTLNSDYEEIAVFGNATWHITSRLDLSFGARYSDNDQSANQTLEGALLGGAAAFQDAKSSESPFTWSVSPRFEVTENTSVYGRVATGYRPGGPNVLPVGAPPGTPASYDSDELTSYEIGVKTGNASGTFALDVTAFYLDWDDIQLFANVNGIGINANGGTAVSKGFEFAAMAMPVEGLTLSFSGAYVDAYLTQNTDPIVGGLDGDPLPYVPEWSFSMGGDYEWAVRGDATAWVGGNVGYTGDRTADFDNRAPDGSLREVDSYVTVNLRAGVSFGRWSLEVYGKNLLNEEGINDIVAEGVLPNGAVGLGLIRPRTIGVSLGATF